MGKMDAEAASHREDRKWRAARKWGQRTAKPHRAGLVRGQRTMAAVPGAMPRKQGSLCSTAKNLRASGLFPWLRTAERRRNFSPWPAFLIHVSFQGVFRHSMKSSTSLSSAFSVSIREPLSLVPCCSLASSPISLSALLQNINSGLDLDSLKGGVAPSTQKLPCVLATPWRESLYHVLHVLLFMCIFPMSSASAE